MNSVWDSEADPTGAPDYMIVELSSESILPRWAREGVYFPKPVKGLEKLDFGDRMVAHYAYLSVATLFDPTLALKLYIAKSGRVVVNGGIPKETISLEKQ